MSENSGVFIVLEGADGSGKNTQYKLLYERIKAVGYDVEVFDFPQYESESSYFVRQYLDGHYGEATSISPYTASLFYALDRYEAAPKIRDALKAGKVVISNRYVASNMAHQGAKFGTDGEKRGFFVWEDGLEFQTLGIPRPTLNIYLRVPAEISYELITKRHSATSNKKLDQHEADFEYLKNAAYTYDLLSKLFPKDFKIINCVKEGKLMSVPQISNQIWSEIKLILPPNPPREGHETVLDLSKLGISKNVTPKPKKIPKKLVPDITSSNPIEHIEIKNISLLSANILKLMPGISVKIKLKWPSNTTNQGVFTFGNLSNKLQSSYRQHNNQLSELYLNIKDKLSPGNRQSTIALIGITPLYALTDVHIDGTKDEILYVANTLRFKSFSEANWLAGQLETALGVKSNNLSHAINSHSQIDINKANTELTKNIDSKSLSGNKIVNLVKYWPKNEFELIENSFFSNSSLPLQIISAGINNLSYNQKLSILETLLKSNANNLTDGINYKLEIISPYTSVRSLLKSGNIIEASGQIPTTSIGYVIPEYVKVAEIRDEYEMCFTLCEDIYREFEVAGKSDLTPYLTLNNHLSRWQIGLNATGLRALLEAQIPGTGKLINHIIVAIEEIHPIISESLYSGKNVFNTKQPKNRSTNITKINNSKINKSSNN